MSTIYDSETVTEAGDFIEDKAVTVESAVNVLALSVTPASATENDCLVKVTLAANPFALTPSSADELPSVAGVVLLRIQRGTSAAVSITGDQFLRIGEAHIAYITVEGDAGVDLDIDCELLPTT